MPVKCLYRPIELAFLALILVASGCDITSPGEDQDQPLPELSAAEKQVVASDNRFGLKLFQALVKADPDSNVFISPLSVSLALGMTLNGAADSTYEAMKNALEKAGLTETEINAAYRDLIDLLKGLDPKVKFQIANSIWYREGFSVEQAFLEVNRTYFDAEVEALDFSSAAAVEIINAWVEDKTNGLIDKILEEPINPSVVMYLINAIYFKGTWTYEFDKEETREQPFYNLDGSVSTVPLMTLEGTLPALYTDTFMAVDLPYGDSLYSMTVFLPHEGQDIDALAEQVDNGNWDQWIGQLAPSELRLFSPRFVLEWKDSLNNALIALGMGIAFGHGADFSRINPSGGLYISRVLHKTYVEVNEEGTEAAAVTAVEIIKDSSGGSTIMRVDRPFLFAIRERHSGSILFIGKVATL